MASKRTFRACVKALALSQFRNAGTGTASLHGIAPGLLPPTRPVVPRVETGIVEFTIHSEPVRAVDPAQSSLQPWPRAPRREAHAIPSRRFVRARLWIEAPQNCLWWRISVSACEPSPRIPPSTGEHPGCHRARSRTSPADPKPLHQASRSSVIK